jgi:hypothetical protein
MTVTYNLKLTKPHKNHIKNQITTFSNQQSSNTNPTIFFFFFNFKENFIHFLENLLEMKQNFKFNWCEI